MSDSAEPIKPTAAPVSGWTAAVPWLGPDLVVYGETKAEAEQRAEHSRAQHLAALQLELSREMSNASSAQHSDILDRIVAASRHLVEAHETEVPNGH